MPGCSTHPGSLISEGPPGYVPIDRGDFEWRAMSAQGVVAGARSFAREPAGTLDFWATVTQKELESGKGYVMESSEPVTSANGVTGRAMRFAAAEMSYFVVLYVTETRIVTFEAGGVRAELEKDMATLKAFAVSMLAAP